MGKWFRTMLLAALFSALGAAAAADGPPFSSASPLTGDARKPTDGRPRPATSEVEKTLDKLLRLSEKRSGLVDVLLGRTGGGKGDADAASELTTSRLRHDLAALERWTVRENNKGRSVPGEQRGLDYNPLTCAQDVSDAPYGYRTTASTADRADIAYFWPGEADPLARFAMVREAGGWKLDGVWCLP